VRVQNEKRRDSTICEKEFHQQKLSVRAKKKKMRGATIREESHEMLCKEDTQKLSEGEDRPCEEISLSNMTVSSCFSLDVMQVHKENDVVNYGQSPIFDEEDQVMPMNKDDEISLYLQHKDQTGGNNNANASHSTDASSVAFEEDLIIGSFATTAALLPLQNLVKYDTYAYVASHDVELIVHQDLCENERNIAILRESETKSELSECSHYDLESTNNENVRDTPQRNKECECHSCEDIFETNPLIPTTSVLFSSVQVCNKNKEDMAVHDVIILVEIDEKVANQPNQLCAAQNIKLDEAVGKILETSSMILAQPQIIQGTKNDSDFLMKNIVVSDCDKAHVSNKIDRNICFADNLQVDNQCSVIHDNFYVFIWLIYMILCTHISSTMHVNKFGDVEMNTHDIIVSAIEPNPNLCADFIEHVDKFDHKIFDDNNICTLIG
jgi:hypothetical protein